MHIRVRLSQGSGGSPSSFNGTPAARAFSIACARYVGVSFFRRFAGVGKPVVRARSNALPSRVYSSDCSERETDALDSSAISIAAHGFEFAGRNPRFTVPKEP